VVHVGSNCLADAAALAAHAQKLGAAAVSALAPSYFKPHSTYNFAAPIYHRLMAAFAKGDQAAAREEQRRSVRLVQLLFTHGFMGAAKAVMKMLGVDVGPARLPNATLSAAQVGTLEGQLG
jgi:dihydrodipicolinate synthase/N-acetylneuraminate lyase